MEPSYIGTVKLCEFPKIYWSHVTSSLSIIYEYTDTVCTNCKLWDVVLVIPNCLHSKYTLTYFYNIYHVCNM